MNHDSQSNRRHPQEWDDAQSQICERFESAFKKEPEARIEQMIPQISKALNDLGIQEEKQPDFVRFVMAELIYVEMELRNEQDELVDPFRYHRRFPDLVSVIDESFKRIRHLNASSRKLKETLSIQEELAEADQDDTKIAIPVEAESSQEIPNKLGPYDGVTEIGSGSFGIVCRAIHSKSGSRVALKFPRSRVLASQRLLKLFLDEADRVMKLNHAGIARTYAVERIEGYLVIVQQLIDGKDLGESIRQKRSFEEIAELVAQVAEALAYSARKGIVHRDLKPSNILLDAEGKPFIVDYGMALDENVQLSAPNMRCGTVPYMSPQLVAGLTKNLDGRTDIWSLGVILYELLTHRRPFRGITEDDIFIQIETRDPKPLREIDGGIPAELERICLKCLEKFAKNRYLTGNDLAGDLRHWIEEQQEEPEKQRQETFATIVPKGLRSFGVQDSDFFLDLLPGPRDRYGIPASIRFWKVRIQEPVADENRVPVGLIYGPSGSGKSSFVKAGLLPQLDDSIETIYLESTQDDVDTEGRLFKTLRAHFPEIPDDITLPELFRGLSFGKWSSSGKKTLIVLDQFEQRLSVADDYAQSPISKALRHCDGEQLQALLLIRDDFFLAISRFADTLEMDLLEGHNSQVIDLFDPKHAQEVLKKFGRAYGQLPPEPQELSKSQQAFVDTVIEQLTDAHGYIICVRLSLFAEMFKGRPWTVSELKSVGGASGVGRKFLEEKFGHSSSNKRFARQREYALRILNALLPDEGFNIRGATKAKSDLISAVKLIGQEPKFDEAIKILDQELKLISKTEFGNDDADLNEKLIGFQLTHDYLVPAIRSWINGRLEGSPNGRIKIQFEKLAKSWNDKEDSHYIPTFLEFIQIFRYLRKDLNADERRLYSVASRRHIRNALLILVLVVTSLSVWQLNRLTQKREVIRQLVGRFLSCHPDAFESSLFLLNQQNKNLAIRELESQLQSTTRSRQRLRVYLGLASLGSHEEDALDYLCESITKANDDESKNIIAALAGMDLAPTRIFDEYQECKRIDIENPERRVRLVLTLGFIGSYDQASNLIANETTDFATQLPRTIITWHGNLSEVYHWLEHSSEESVKSTYCLAVGKLFEESLLRGDLELFSQVLKRTHDGCETGQLLSSSAWALQSLGYSVKPREQDPSITTLKTEENSQESQVVRVESINLLMSRISGTDRTIRSKIGSIDLKTGEDFYAGVREITVGDFRQFLADSDFQGKKPIGIQLDKDNEMPMRKISFVDSIMFCNWISVKEGLSPCYRMTNKRFKLDKIISLNQDYVESLQVPLYEWERVPNANGFRLPLYSERLFLEQRNPKDFFPIGSRLMSRFLTDYAWISPNSYDQTLGKVSVNPVKSKMPNEFGLFDVCGNVSEFCWDFPFKKLMADPDANGFYAVTRGSNYNVQISQIKPSYYNKFMPFIRAPQNGLRVVTDIR